MTQGKWTNDFLEAMRQETDPLADAVIADLFAHGETGEVMKLHRMLLAEGDLTQPDLPPVLADYRAKTGQLPSWADPELILIAEKVLMSHGLIAFVILAGASLPECYADARGVPALVLTQKLTEHAKRRILETSQFIIQVLTPGALVEGGKGILAAQMIRLMHASIRHLILTQPASSAERAEQTADFVTVLHQHTWDASLGQPLNQEDMAYTLQTFAWVTVRSLRVLEAGMTPREEEAIIHCWNVIGHVLGIRRDLMPQSVEEAELLFTTIKRRVVGPSQDSQLLTRGLLGFLEEFWTKDVPIPDTKLDLKIDALSLIPPMIIRELIDEATAAQLGVPVIEPSLKEKLTRFLLGDLMREALHVDEKVLHGSSKLRQMSDVLFRTMLKKVTQMPRGWQRQLFAIPTELEASWGVTDTTP